MNTTRLNGVALALLALVWLANPVLLRATPDWSMAMGLYGDLKARQIGDLVTVIIEESSTVNREAQQASNKSTTGGGSASAGYPQVEVDGANRETPWTSASLPEFSWQFRNGFTGGGQMSSQEDFTSTMSARVMDVLPNGNLLLEGKRMVHLQDEQIEIILTGMVRPRDITSGNTVPSSRLADASIRYVSNGPISREQRRGMLTRLVNWLNIF